MFAPDSAAAAGYLVRVETEPTQDFDSFVGDLFSALSRATEIAGSGVLDLPDAEPVFVVVRDKPTTWSRDICVVV